MSIFINNNQESMYWPKSQCVWKKILHTLIDSKIHTMQYYYWEWTKQITRFSKKIVKLRMYKICRSILEFNFFNLVTNLNVSIKSKERSSQFFKYVFFTYRTLILDRRITFRHKTLDNSDINRPNDKAQNDKIDALHLDYRQFKWNQWNQIKSNWKSQRF